ncbi:MAG: lipoprotein-releasing ABC transporter permease subunit [Pseudomonadota bacterium]
MYRPLELFIGLRYTRAKRKNHFISFISLISMGGILLGVTALITVLSVMNGFQNEVRDRILGMTAHVEVQSYGKKLDNWDGVADRALEEPRILGAAPYVRGEAMYTSGDFVQGGLVNGIEPEREKTISMVDDNMVAGSMADLEPGGFGVLIGRGLARQLGVSVGDRVTLVTPRVNMGPTGFAPRLKRFNVVGIFEVGMHEYDSGLGLIHLEDAQTLYRMDDAVTGVRMVTEDLFSAPETARHLGRTVFDGQYWVTDWTHRHANFFRALKIEKAAMFIILSLIVAVAAFNIVSTLVMVVTDKQGDIAILRTLGASPRTILGIFVIQGTFIGFIGTALGVTGGVLLASNVGVIVPFIENRLGIEFLPSSVYYISELPSEVRWSEVTTIGVISFALSALATLYPAWKASRTRPAEALRYE